MSWIELFLLMIGGHAIGDYALQSDFLAKAKNHKAPLLGVPWYQALFAHSAIHGVIVGLITGSWVLGLAETIAHAMTDYGKSHGVITYNQDQALHVIHKAVWASAAFAITQL